MPFRITSLATPLAFWNTLRGHTHTVAHTCLFCVLTTQVWIILGLLDEYFFVTVSQMNLHIFSDLIIVAPHVFVPSSSFLQRFVCRNSLCVSILRSSSRQSLTRKELSSRYNAVYDCKQICIFNAGLGHCLSPRPKEGIS